MYETNQSLPEQATIVIGITGGIGSGKSTIANALHLPVYDSDSRAKQLVAADSELSARVSALVAQDPFAHKQVMDELNKLIHPRVLRDCEQWIKDMARHHNRLVIESAILFRSSMNKLCDVTIAVTAPEQVRIARIMARNSLSQVEAVKRLRAQTPQDETDKADYVIINDGNHTIDEIIKQINTI